MAAANSTVPITKCPPGAAQNAVLDEYVYEKATQRFPVHATSRGGGEFETPGLDFSDYARCGTYSRKLASSRKLPAPEWVFQPEQLRAVLVRQMEARASFRCPQPGSEVERLQRAQDCIAARIPAREEDLTRLCQRLVALKAEPQCNAELVRRLAISIEGLDSFLLLSRQSDRGAGVLARIATLYFSGLDSVAVAEEVGMKPPAVRAQIWRMRKTWEKMQEEMPVGWRPSITINLLKRMPVPVPVHTVRRTKRATPAVWQPRIRINLFKRMPAPAPVKRSHHRPTIVKNCVICGAECPKRARKFCGKACLKRNIATSNPRARHTCVKCAGPLPPFGKKYCAGCRVPVPHVGALYFGPHIRINLLKRKPLIPRVCVRCGADITGLHGNSDYCGIICYRDAFNIRRKLSRAQHCAEISCKRCGKLCAPGRRKFCSQTCVNESLNERRCRPDLETLFEEARKRMHRPERKTCKHGHAICLENAHVGDLKRTGLYSCNPCWQASNARYKARLDAALQRIRNAPLSGA
jgi:hypothetical protein